MEFERCGCCRRYVPERELEPSSIYGLVCEDCFWDNKRYQREEEVEDEAEYWEWLRKQEQDKQAIRRGTC